MTQACSDGLYLGNILRGLTTLTANTERRILHFRGVPNESDPHIVVDERNASVQNWVDVQRLCPMDNGKCNLLFEGDFAVLTEAELNQGVG